VGALSRIAAVAVADYSALEAIAGIICLVIGQLAFERARKLGGLTIFAAPSRS